MIQSMTGFGKAEGEVASKKVSIQIRSLNSKQSDIITKLPNLFKELELDFRKKLAELLSRGKIELSLQFEEMGNTSQQILNEELVQNYFAQIEKLGQKLNAKTDDILSSILRFPDVLSTASESLSDVDKKAAETLLEEAINQVIQFRIDEGKSLASDLLNHTVNIENLLSEALQYENERIQTVRERLKSNLDDLLEKNSFNEDRFEQELIYYLEKYDISEEKVRLKTHCEYFKESLNAEAGQGKKLGFISQEMGREINTLGSKANHAEMQKLVVQMKEELEKIKEQVLNVL